MNPLVIIILILLIGPLAAIFLGLRIKKRRSNKKT